MASVPTEYVLVGLLDQRILEPQVVGWETSKVGGLPAWLDSDTTRPAPTCKNCGQASSLVSQIYCPLGGSAYHRCVYLFVCPRGCSRQQNGWRVFRSLKLDSSFQPELDQMSAPQASKCLDEIWDQDQNDWGDDADDWGEESGGMEEETQQERSCEFDIEDDFEQTARFACRQAGSGSLPVKSLVSADSQETESPNNCLDRCDPSSPLLPPGLESLSQLTLVDDVAQLCEQPSRGEDAAVSCDNFEDAEVPLVLETMGLADAQRWDAVAELLNTKIEQNSKMPDIAEPKGIVVFEPYFLSVLEEPNDETADSDHLKELIKIYERSEGKQLHLLMSESPRTLKDKDRPVETYERTELKHGDKMFHKFLKRLQRCPQQCIRYERGGNPLLVSSLPEERVSECPCCQGKRIFELQLLPQLIPSLKAEDGTAIEVDFGTVLVFTCERNCLRADLDPACKLDLLEECIILQGDPDMHLYR